MYNITSSDDIKVWTDHNYINFDNIKNILNLSNDISDFLKVQDNDKEIFGDKTVDALAVILKSVYADRRYTLDPTSNIRVKYLDNTKQKVYKIDSQTINSIDIARPESVYGLINSFVSSNYTSDINIITFSLI